MPVYDTTLILNPQLEESGIDGRIKETVELIQRHGGTVKSENRMGMRRMAYEIRNVTQGYYANLVFQGDRKVVDELERMFRLDEGCLRYLTCHYQDFSRRRPKAERKPKPPREEKPAPAREPEDKPKEEAAEKPAETPEEKPEETPSAESTPEPETKPAPESETKPEDKPDDSPESKELL